jgi:hypothetical protein
MIVVVSLLLVMLAMTPIVSVPVMVTITVPKMMSPVVAIMVVVFGKGKSAKNQGQAQK